jgi:hypothetical protein
VVMKVVSLVYSAMQSVEIQPIFSTLRYIAEDRTLLFICSLFHDTRDFVASYVKRVTNWERCGRKSSCSELLAGSIPIR